MTIVSKRESLYLYRLMGTANANLKEASKSKTKIFMTDIFKNTLKNKITTILFRQKPNLRHRPVPVRYMILLLIHRQWHQPTM